MTILDDRPDTDIIDLSDHEFDIPCESMEMHEKIGKGLPAAWIMQLDMTRDCECGPSMSVLVCDNCKNFYTTTEHGAQCKCGKTKVYPFRKIILSVEPLK